MNNYIDLVSRKIDNKKNLRASELELNNLRLQKEIIMRKKFEVEIIESNKKVEYSDKIKTEFFSQISHEIRTPVNSILLGFEFLKEELLEKGIDEYSDIFESMNSSGKRITRTIELLLNMSDVLSGSYDFKPEYINLSTELLPSICGEYEIEAKRKGLELNFNSLEDFSIIYGDKYTLQEIFKNLIDNAIKFTEKGKIDISLKVGTRKNIEVIVEDSGIGISNDYLSNLFKLFTQEEQGYRRKYDGNGLGLALVKKYCDLNRANILISSQKWKGTKITIQFNTNFTQRATDHELTLI
ncbi:MAG: HAMP domain-containing histidine kinase [Melioribacteraceae bacterium]|nr:HAMP domain-containing histidine kinase [Melioribacteraceae bacterium]